MLYKVEIKLSSCSNFVGFYNTDSALMAKGLDNNDNDILHWYVYYILLALLPETRESQSY